MRYSRPFFLWRDGTFNLSCRQIRSPRLWFPAPNSFGRSGQESNLLEHHPTPKPVQMIADAILDCTQRGAIVLDPLLGSGSTLMAAERVGRVCYGIEIDPLYVDLTLRRFQQLTGQEPIHAETGLTFAQYAAEVAHV